MSLFDKILPRTNKVYEVRQNGMGSGSNDPNLMSAPAMATQSPPVNAWRDMNRYISNDDLRRLYVDYTFAAIRKAANKAAEIITDNIETGTVDLNSGKYTPSDTKYHPYLKAIHKGAESDRDFWTSIATYVLTTGDAYVYTGERKMQSGGIKLPDTMSVLQSNMVVALYDSKNNQVGWRVKPIDKYQENKDYLVENVIDVRDFNLFDMRAGYGVLRPILHRLNTEDQANMLRLAMLQNGLATPGMLQLADDIKDGDFENVKQQVNERWRGAGGTKAGSPIIARASDMNYKEIVSDYDKLAMESLSKVDNAAIFAALGASKTILGIEESGTTRDTSRIMTENWIEDFVMPLVDTIADCFNQDFINNYPGEYARQGNIEIRVPKPTARDVDTEETDAQINELNARALNFLITAGYNGNDALKFIGYEEKMGWSADQIKGVTPAATTPTTTDTSGGTTNSMTVNVTPGEQVAHDHHINPSLKANDFSTDDMTQRQQSLAGDVANVDATLEKYYVNQDTTSYDDQTKYLEDLGLILLAYGLSEVFDAGNAQSAALAPLALKLQGKVPVNGIQFTLDNNTHIALQELAKSSAQGHYDYIDKKVRDMIAKATADGKSETEITQMVRQMFGEQITKTDAQRLAVDQSRRAYKNGKLLADQQWARQNGLQGQAYKVFRNRGADPCKYCQSLNGERVPLDQNFLNVGDVIQVDEDDKIKTFKIGYQPVSSGVVHPYCDCDYDLEVVVNGVTYKL